MKQITPARQKKHDRTGNLFYNENYAAQDGIRTAVIRCDTPRSARDKILTLE